MENKEKIRNLNDQLRKHILNPNGLGLVCLSEFVSQMSVRDRYHLLRAIARFKRFDEGNDPWQEHDFAAVEYKKNRYFFKIDYYDKDLLYGSADPSDSRQTCRVLTVMLASEY